jgi:hypothetical protein
VSTQSSEPRQDRVIPLAGGADSAGEWIYVSTTEARARVGLPLSLAHARHRVLRDTVPHGIPRYAVRDTMLSGIPCFARYHAQWDTMLSGIPHLVGYHAKWDTTLSGIPRLVGYHAKWDTMLSGIPC